MFFLIQIVFETQAVYGAPLEYNKELPLGDVVTIEQAVDEFEQVHKQDIKLPYYIPFEVTYSGGIFNPVEKSLLILYLNEKTGALMDVHVQEGKRPRQLTSKQRLLKVNMGSNYTIFDSEEKRGVNFIYFYIKGLEYRVALTKRPIEYKQDTFIKVVESFN